MPSPHYVPVTTISAISAHPNADSLDIAQVLGWQCVVGRGQFKEGDKVVYFPPDSVLPRELSDQLGVTQYLSKQRIKATRLRGEPSFGLVIPAPADFHIGDTVSEYYGVTKYEPPTREAQRGQGKFIPNPDHLPKDPLFPEYTSINNLRYYPDLLDGELVVITEKLHGTNSRIGIVDGQWMAGSHRVRRGEADELYWSPRKHAEHLVSTLAKKHRQVVLFGEILGGDVQSLDYGYKGHEGYFAFDLMIDGRYVDYQSFVGLCAHYGVPVVPLFYVGPYAFGLARHYAQGNTALHGGDGLHLREGVVVKPLVERHDPRIGRVVLKYVSDDFLLAKKSDFSEV